MKFQYNRPMGIPFFLILLTGNLLVLFSFAATYAASESVRLPDGTLFHMWEVSPKFTRTFHVAQQHQAAADDNPGTENRPWKTIAKAAATLQPGERVIIHRGIYREWVRPARGGTGPDRMISYEAAPNEEVVIKGSDVWKPCWEKNTELLSGQTSVSWQLIDKRWQATYPKTSPTVAIWKTELSGQMFEGANPFCLQNWPHLSNPGWKVDLLPTFELRRGQIFMDGKPLLQVGDASLLRDENVSFWVEDNGMTIYLRLPDPNDDPNIHTWEITTREQVFAPKTEYLGYIRVKGLHMLHAANGVPIPKPQRGLISAMRGHHWIIEDCEIGYANTLGADIGNQWWYPPNERWDPSRTTSGFHIFRRNNVHDCGISGLSAWHGIDNVGLLIEDNIFTNCSWMPVTEHWESAGVKLHQLVNSVIRRNIILDSKYGGSLWVDGFNKNIRITQNLLANDPPRDLQLGHLFVEVSPGPVLVDNNLLINGGYNAVYTNNTGEVLMVQNLFLNGSDYAIKLYGDHGRSPEPAGWENNHCILGNIFAGFAKGIVVPNLTSRSNYNLWSGLNVNQTDAFQVEKPLATHKIYINGVMAGQTSMSWLAYPGNLFKNMGGDAAIGSQNGGNIFRGGIDDLRIYKTVLSESEISYLAGGGGRTTIIAGAKPNDANLISHYTFDTNYSDSGTLPRNGNAVGSVVIAAGGPDGSPCYLDLNGGYVDLPAYDGPGWLTSGVTITAWVKKDAPASNGDIFSYDWPSKTNGSIQMRTTASGINVQSLVEVNAPNGSSTADQWFHVAWVANPIQMGKDFAGWKNAGQDTDSVLIPLEFQFDMQKLELTVKATPGTTLPLFENAFWPTVPEVAPFVELLTEDFYGQQRTTDKLVIGPFIKLSVDGTPMRVDPRKTNPK
ncbi:MAG: hypothetical protein A2Y13_03915 [Planctomycetes bacterium GWC2_45_44]|nr:MAG: hypothetical protein A2Y13_03915 [Planctomycetes bacterium GWC2_45_44]